MSVGIKVIDIVTIIISVMWAIKAFKKLREGSRYLFFLIIFCILVLPIILDYTIGPPNYNSTYTMSQFKGFIISEFDTETRVLYDLFLILTQFLILNYKPKYHITVGNSRSKGSYTNIKITSAEFYITNKERNTMLVLAAFAPVLALLFGFDFTSLFIFGWREQLNTFFYTETSWYSTVEELSYIGVVASLCGTLLKDQTESRLEKLKIVCSAILLYVNICIESKRSIIFFVLIMYVIIRIFISNSRKGIWIITIITLCFATVVVFYTIFLKYNIRGYSTIESVYASMRIDLFRDDTVRMSIYSLLGKEMSPILDYPLQSYISQIAYIFPLDYLKGMDLLPLPKCGYNTYLTSALIGASISEGNNFMTTSMFDEIISNFWFLGFIISGVFIVRVSQIIDKLGVFEKIIWTGAIVLLFFYAPSYVLYYIEIAFIYTCIIKKVTIRA